MENNPPVARRLGGGPDATIVASPSLDRFQAQPKWEIPDDSQIIGIQKRMYQLYQNEISGVAMNTHRIDRIVACTLCLGLLIGVCQDANAATWNSLQNKAKGLVGKAKAAAVGEDFDVDVIISDLGNGSPPSLGAYDLDIGFDPAIVSPMTVTFGNLLGDPGMPSETVTSFSFSPGSVDLGQESFLTPTRLDGLQSDSFTLATITFKALAVGTSPLTYQNSVAFDAFGDPLASNTEEGSVTVVPEPTNFALGLIGMLMLSCHGRRRRRL